MPPHGGMSQPGVVPGPHGGMPPHGMPQGPPGIPHNSIPSQAVPPGMQHPGMQNGPGLRAQPRGQTIEPSDIQPDGKKNNPWFKWVIIGGIVLILAVGGFMAWRWYTRKQKKSKENVVGTMSSNALPPPNSVSPPQVVHQLSSDGGISDALAPSQAQPAPVPTAVVESIKVAPPSSVPLETPIVNQPVSATPAQSSNSDLLERLKKIG